MEIVGGLVKYYKCLKGKMRAQYAHQKSNKLQKDMEKTNTALN